MLKLKGKPFLEGILVSPVFMKILAIFFVVLTPVYLVGLNVNFIGQRELREKTVLAAIPKMDDGVLRMEREIGFVLDSMMKLHVNPDLRLLSTTTPDADTYLKMKAILNLATRLGEISEQSQFVEEISLYVPMIGKKITSQGNQTMNWTEFLLFRDIGETGTYPFCRIDASNVMELYNVKREGKDTYLTLMPFHSLVRVNGLNVPPYLFTMRLSMPALQSLLKEVALSTGGEGFLVDKGNGLDASTTGEDPPFRQSDIMTTAERDGSKVRTMALTLHLDGVPYLALTRHSTMLDTSFISVVRQTTFLASLQHYQFWLWAATGLTLMMVLVFTFLIRAMFITPLHLLVEGFSRLEKGDTSVRLDTRNHDEFRYLFHRFNEMCINLSRSIEQIYAQRILMQRAELKQLQYQINPHFLYNTLFIVYRMAKREDHESVMKLALHLGGYYRFVTKGAEDEVTWQEEASHVSDYVQIQTIRFVSRIKVEFRQFPAEMQMLRVPRLVLQPLVENAFHHGMSGKTSNGLIQIQAFVEEAWIRVVVEDNGDALDDDTLDRLSVRFLHQEENPPCTLEGHYEGPARQTTPFSQENTDPEMADMECDNALMNIHRRLWIRFGPGSGLHASRSDLGGLRMEIRVAKA